MPASRPRWRRVFVRLAIFLLACALLAGGLLKTSTGRGWIFSVLAARLERDTGLQVRIDSSELSILRGEVTFYDVHFQAAERERPFLTAVQVRAEFDWTRLIGHPMRINRVFVDDVAADPAMFPAGGRGGGDGGPLPLTVDDVRWQAGSVGPLLGGVNRSIWFDQLFVTGIDGEGRLENGFLQVVDSSGVLEIYHPDRPQIDLDVDLRANLGLDGSIRGGEVELLGEGCQANAQVSASDASHVLVVGRLDAQLGLLFPDLTSTGHAQLEGRVGWAERRLIGNGHATVRELPAELLAPVMQGALAEIELAGKQLEAEGSYRLDLPLRRVGDPEEDREELDLEFDSRLKRGREILLQAKLTASSDGQTEHPLRVTWDASVMPAAADRFLSRGALRLRGWDNAEGAIIDRAAATASFRDVGAAAQRFGLLPESVEALRPVGAMSLDFNAAGPIETLGFDGRLAWWRGESAVLSASAETDDLASGVRLDGAVLGGEPGTREWTALVIPDSETGWAEPRLESTHASVLLPDPYGAGEQIAAIHEALFPTSPRPPWIDLLLAADPKLGGQLTLELDAEGPLARPAVDAVFAWQPGTDETLDVLARGFFPPMDLDACELETVEAEARNLSLKRLSALLPSEMAERMKRGTTDASLRMSGPLLDPRMEFEFDSSGFEYEGIPSLERLSARLSRSAERWILEDLLAAWEDPAYGILRASATAVPGTPIRELTANMALEGMPGTAERAEARVDFRDGLARIVSGRLILEGGEVGTITGAVPLGGVLAVPMLAESDGTTTLQVQSLDIGAIVAQWVDDDALELTGKLSGEIEVDLNAVAGATGHARLDGFRFQLGEEQVETVGALDFRYGDGGLTLAPGRLLAASSVVSGTAPLDVGGHVRFDSAWTVDAPWYDVIAELEATVDGNVSAAFLAPILGATGAGPVELHVRAGGRPGDLSINGTMRGEKAQFFISDPYPTRIENFDVKVSTDGRTIRIDEATADINGGRGRVEGVVAGEDGLLLNGGFQGVRYRLGFGITTRLDADLTLKWPTEGRELSGIAVIDRALLNRDLNLDREILRAVFDPELDTGTSRLLETVDLDLEVLTDQGLIIRNNLAEMRADWSRLEVRGTLADPLLTGVVDVAPGGRLYLLGETLRVDEASLAWSGSAPDDPTISFQTTSSREDPTIGQSWRSGWYTTDLGPGQGGSLGFWGATETSSESSLGASLATYTQDRLYGSLAQVLDRTELSYEPLPLFGETDTEARFTLSQDLTNNLSFVASTNPREAEGQTYILDLHAFRVAPSLRAQVFTGDNETRGATLQQTLVLGKRDVTQAGGDPVIHDRVVTVPEVVKRKLIKRAVGFREGDPFPSGAELDVEVDVADRMRRLGYPDATILVETRPYEKNQVDLLVTVEPGPRIGFLFEGPSDLTRSVRGRMRSTYRSNEEEQRSLAEMRGQAERALRALGCLQPAIEIGPVDPIPGEQRRIRTFSACDREVDLGAPILLGLPYDVAEFVAGGFASPLSRVELASGLLEAQDHLLRTLEAMGYPEATIKATDVSKDGRELTLRIDPGVRRYVKAVRIEGADEETARIARGLVSIRQGDPLRRDWIAASGRALEADLRDRGFAEAVVRRIVEDVPDDPARAVVVFQVQAGRASVLQQVKIEGLGHSKPAWVSNKAELATGNQLRRQEVSAARGRLYRTAVYERIRVTTESLEEGDVGPANPNEPRPVAVAFELDEAPRYQLSYGGRWESDVGLGGVVDLVNRNSLGRGHRTGVRAILNDDVRSLRLYHVIPQPLPSERSSLELFVEGKRENVEDVRSDVIEAWAQLTFPLTDRMLTRVYTAVGERNILSGIPSPDLPLEERVISPRFGWQLAYTTVQQGLLSQRRKGFFFGVDVSGSSASLGSDLTTLGVFTQFKVYAPFGSIDRGRFSWHQSYRAGLLTAREQAIPFVDRLRAGGEFSVRGYPTNGIGPLDIDGTPLGGELLFVANQEFHARVWDSLYGVLFFDAGNVWSSPNDFDPDFFRSVGFGARYTSPVGPLRFDIGFPLDRRPDEDRYQIYVGFGSVF